MPLTPTDARKDTWIGDSFGSDASPYVSWPYNANLYDSLFLSPGKSRNAPLAWFRWDHDAPSGYSQTLNIDAAYAFLEARCNGTSVRCVALPDATGGYAWTRFNASVAEPIPEPSTLLLLSNGRSRIVSGSHNASPSPGTAMEHDLRVPAAFRGWRIEHDILGDV